MSELKWADEIEEGEVIRIVENIFPEKYRYWFRIVKLRQQGEVTTFLGRKVDDTPVHRAYNRIYGFEVRKDFPTEEEEKSDG